jgi:hypothetical protein
MVQGQNRRKVLFAASMMLASVATRAQTILQTKSAEPKQQTKMILIQGPEIDLSDTAKISRKYREAALFNQAFSSYPHRVIGSPVTSVDFKQVTDTVEKFIENCDNLLIFIAMHGNEKFESVQSSGSSINGYMQARNILHAVIEDPQADTLTSQTLFSAIGKKWHTNAKGVILDGICSGSADPSAFTQVPEAKIITLSDPDKGAFIMDGLFFYSFKQLTKNALQYGDVPEQAIKTLVITGMSQNFTGHEVDMRVFMPQDSKTKNGYGGSIISCDAGQLKNTKAWRKLESIVQEEDPLLLCKESIESLQKEFKEKFPMLNDTATNRGYRGWISYLAYRYAKAETRQQKTIMDFVTENNLIVPGYKTESVSNEIVVTFKDDEAISHRPVVNLPHRHLEY